MSSENEKIKATEFAMAQIINQFMQQIRVELDFNVPTAFSDRVKLSKQILDSDVSGLVNPILDFAISAISEVEFSIETDNAQATKVLNEWLQNINNKHKQYIRSGFKTVVTEYAKERFVSGMIVAPVAWESFGTYTLPMEMFVYDGEKVTVEGDDLKEFKYLYKSAAIETDYYVHKYSRILEKYPNPFLIQRVYQNWYLKRYLKEKGAELIRQCLIYFLNLKKGSASRPDLSYGDTEYASIMSSLKSLIENARTNNTTPMHVSGFDTEIGDYIPDISKVFSRTVYEEVDRDILSGLGMIDIVQGVGSTRKESVLNPKPLMNLVFDTICDIRALLGDIVKDIKERNIDSHRKVFSDLNKITIKSTPVRSFYSDDFLILLRSAYDRGRVSSRTFDEALGLDFQTELRRRSEEASKGYDVVMYPPIIMNTEANETIQETTNDELPDDKTNPVEKKNYKNANEEVIATYDSNEELPAKVKKFIADEKLKTAFRLAFNSAFEQKKDLDIKLRETYAFKVAWATVKRMGTLGSDKKWHLKENYK
jgi:cation transport regulator ChaB